jgi:REP element-mobilizing transposase RayT
LVGKAVAIGMATLHKNMGGGGVVVKRSPRPKTWGKARSLRLRKFDYAAGGRVYHVIIGGHRKQRIFVEVRVNQRIIEILRNACRIHGYDLVAYCLMPDHLHVLVECGDGSSGLDVFVKAVKSFATRQVGSKLWQRGFYERVLRRDEDVVRVAEYIVANPVRKGLANDVRGYPWNWCRFWEGDGRPSSQE